MESDIELFQTAGVGRGNNDALNKKRENVLCILYEPPEEYIERNPLWKIMSQKWREFLSTLCSVPYDNVRVKKKGGRKANYDLLIEFMKDEEKVYSVKGEFKHNTSKLDSLPEYLSVATNKPYIPIPYAEYFYDNFIDSICALDPTLTKPERSIYLRHIYKNNYKAHTFFNSLYENESKYYKEKREIVQGSIRNYLEENARSLDINALTEDIRTRQSGKVYILWNLEKFIADTIREEEMEIVSVEEVKNGNVIVVKSRSGTCHNMLLRWKNHLGVLYPAWQISLSR